MAKRQQEQREEGATEFLTIEEVAARLRVRPSTVARWSREGWIPTVWLSAVTRRFVWDDVIRALQARAAQQKGGRRGQRR